MFSCLNLAGGQQHAGIRNRLAYDRSHTQPSLLGGEWDEVRLNISHQRKPYSWVITGKHITFNILHWSCQNICTKTIDILFSQEIRALLETVGNVGWMLSRTLVVSKTSCRTRSNKWEMIKPLIMISKGSKVVRFYCRLTSKDLLRLVWDTFLRTVLWYCSKRTQVLQGNSFF